LVIGRKRAAAIELQSVLTPDEPGSPTPYAGIFFAGPNKGIVYYLVGKRVIIGRGQNADIQILGNCKTEVSGNMETSVMGDFKVKAKTIQMETYEGDMDIKVAGIYSEDATLIYMNSGISTPTGLNVPSETAPGHICRP
jgi:hypothetical protein